MSLRVELDRELEKKFREAAMKRFGYSKGSIKKATEMAIKNWSEKEITTRPTKKKGKSGVDLIVGGLAHLRGKKTSVELQHDAKKLWTKIAEDK